MAKKKTSNPQSLIYILLFLVLLMVIFIVGIYYYKFKDYSVSNDPSMWGVFGDYIGGTLNSIVGIANLIILTYITFQLVKIEDERNNKNYKNSVFPAFNLIRSQSPDEFKIIIHSFGLGPVLIKSLSVITGEGKKYSSLGNYMSTLPHMNMTEYFEIAGIDLSNSVIPINTESCIITVKLREVIKYENRDEAIKNFNDLTNLLQKTKIKINYSDIFDEEIYVYDNGVLKT
ncbi:hypothetical protein [Chryseobacterium gregarium]|uniref:hypothetical protein n=1 Tax=Chryseobacterium gregarium TaxID=456299 RepID=UPI000425FADD|nr:hypothetical protein [Chryseobacterium gregarium]